MYIMYTEYSKSSPFPGVMFLKNPVNGITVMHKVKILWEKWVRGTKHSWNVIIYKVIINKHENIYVFVVYWNDESISGWKSPWWSEGIECMAEGETEDLMKKGAIFKCSAFFCMSLYISFYGVMTVPISCLNFKHLSMKWFISNT